MSAHSIHQLRHDAHNAVWDNQQIGQPRSKCSCPRVPRGCRGTQRSNAEQIRSVSLERIGEQLGVVPRPLMAALDEAASAPRSL